MEVIGPEPFQETRPLAGTLVSPIMGRRQEEDVFDREEVLRRLNGNEALLVRLLRIFNDHAQDELSQIREAMDRADAFATGRHAHALKGSAANVGAVRVQALARDMEQTAEMGDLAPLDALVAQTEREFGVFVSATQGFAT